MPWSLMHGVAVSSTLAGEVAQALNPSTGEAGTIAASLVYTVKLSQTAAPLGHTVQDAVGPGPISPEEGKGG